MEEARFHYRGGCGPVTNGSPLRRPGSGPSPPAGPKGEGTTPPLPGRRRGNGSAAEKLNTGEPCAPHYIRAAPPLSAGRTPGHVGGTTPAAQHLAARAGRAPPNGRPEQRPASEQRRPAAFQSSTRSCGVHSSHLSAAAPPLPTVALFNFASAFVLYLLVCPFIQVAA